MPLSNWAFSWLLGKLNQPLQVKYIKYVLFRCSLQKEKRKRPRGPSPSATSVLTANQTGNNRGVSITLPARPSPTGSVSREFKSRKDALQKQLPLQQGRKVAFHPGGAKSAHGGADTDENTWILALITRCMSSEKQR